MRRSMPFFFLILCSIISYTPAHAQSWRWGKSGGSTDQPSSQLVGPDETATDIATDPNGNTYVLSKVYETTLQVDGHPITVYSAADMANVLISSFACDGRYRWSKFIGSSSGSEGISIKTDASGGVYILCGTDSYHTVYFDADTTIPGTGTLKQLTLIKYDTAGHFKWYRMPEPDTVRQAQYVQDEAYDIDVDTNGDVSMLCLLRNGPYANGSYIVSSANPTSMHLLKYNSTGTFLSGLPLGVNVTGLTPWPLYLKIDHGNGRIYITGAPEDIANAGTMRFGAIDSVTRAMFIGCLNADGSEKWYRQNTNIYSGTFERAAIDEQHSIYLAGNSESIYNNDTFNNYVLTNPLAPYGNYPVVVKLDTNGNNIWITNGYSVDNTPLLSIALNGNEVVVAGSCPGPLHWVGTSDSLSTNYYDIFIGRFNKNTGALISLDSLPRYPGDMEFGMCMAADRAGNVYVAGNFDGRVYANTDTLNIIGGFSDFCVVKFGYDNCKCVDTPVAHYTYTLSTNNNAARLIYTGTTSGIDSVVWSFGDGSHATGDTAIHTYLTSGTYTACATAYNSCGSNTYCYTLNIPTAVASISAFPELAVYPNPVAGELFIEHAPMGTIIKLFNIVGQQVFSSVIANNKQVLNIKKLPAGTYLLQLKDDKNNRTAMTIIKQ